MHFVICSFVIVLNCLIFLDVKLRNEEKVNLIFDL